MKATFLVCGFLFVTTVTSSPARPSVRLQDQCGPGNPEEAAKAVNNLAKNLYHLNYNPKKNILFSPIIMAVDLALDGSYAPHGAAQNEIKQLIAPRPIDRPDSMKSYSQLRRQLLSNSNSRRSLLNVATAFWHTNKNFDMNKYREFMDTATQCFQAEDLSDGSQGQNILRRMNQWGSDKTNGRITQVITSLTNTVFNWANIVYFKSAWGSQFSADDSRPFPDRSPNPDGQNKISLIRSDEGYVYSGMGYEAVKIPYGDSLSMIVINTKDPKQIDGIGSSLSITDLLSAFEGSQARLKRAPIVLPKFSMRHTFDWKDAMQRLGVRTVFTYNMDGYIHDAFIKVDVNGTEAAATTNYGAQTFNFASPPKTPGSVVIDRPFLFYIVHKPTSMIVFMGKVVTIDKDL